MDLDKTVLGKYSPEDSLAEEHWKFLERWMHVVFVDAFVHGYKHAKEDTVKVDCKCR